MLLPPIDPKFFEACQRAARREQTLRADWQRHFSHRMSYDEYNYINYLTLEVRNGTMGIDRARDDLKLYREHHAKGSRPV
jgi:hypothetical protein